MSDDDGNGVAELAVMLDSFYDEPDYDEAVVRLKALAVAAPFAIGGVPLWTAEGALDPEQWDTVTKPFEFEGGPFKIHILRPVSAVVCGTKQIAFAFPSGLTSSGRARENVVAPGDARFGVRPSVINILFLPQSVRSKMPFPFASMFGIAAYADKVYGFSHQGDIVQIDNSTGSACLLNSLSSMAFAGAGVTTSAP